jgi:cytochrome b6-f complex iron-sulfur subunit
MAEPNQPSEPTPAQPAPTPETAVTPTPPSPPAAAPSPAVAAGPPPAPTAPAAPPKPAAQAPAEPTRRNFLVRFSVAAALALFGSWFATAWTTFTLSMIGMTLGTVRFMFPNVLSEPPSTFKAGDASGYEEGKVDDRFKEIGAWVIRNKDERGRDIIYALSTTCTHLGCTPNWLEAEKKFKCPCHGSGFKISGVNFEGPAPRPLERYAIKKTDDGQIVVDKSRKFQKELGQWNESDSYVLL